MTNDPRYTQWLEIADDLTKLDEFVYGEPSLFAHRKNDTFRPTGIEASDWIRHKCAKGGWYWWDKTTIAGKAEEPLHTLQRVIGDNSGLYENTDIGREMIAKIERLNAKIAAALK